MVARSERDQRRPGDQNLFSDTPRVQALPGNEVVERANRDSKRGDRGEVLHLAEAA